MASGAESSLAGELFTEDDDEMEEQPEMTMQLELFQRNPLDPWMQTVVDMSQQFCMRTINVIYNTHDNNGKSMLCEYMEYHKKALEIPAFRMMKDIMQCVMSQKPSKCYLIDMPRGLKKDKLGEFYSGIECLRTPPLTTLADHYRRFLERLPSKTHTPSTKVCHFESGKIRILSTYCCHYRLTATQSPLFFISRRGR